MIRNCHKIFTRVMITSFLCYKYIILAAFKVGEVLGPETIGSMPDMLVGALRHEH